MFSACLYLCAVVVRVTERFACPCFSRWSFVSFLTLAVPASVLVCGVPDHTYLLLWVYLLGERVYCTAIFASAFPAYNRYNNGSYRVQFEVSTEENEWLEADTHTQRDSFFSPPSHEGEGKGIPPFLSCSVMI